MKGADDEAKPYTPVSPSDQQGWFRLVVKSYPGGLVSSYLHSLHAGDYIQVKGPFVKLEYKANNNKSIGLIAGGTGITPMLQIIREVIKNPSDTTKMSLLYQCRSESDIAMLRDEINELVSCHDCLTVTYILSQPSGDWTGLRGHMDGELLAKTMPLPIVGEEAPLIYVCGPFGMLSAVAGPKANDNKSQGELKGLLKTAGYSGELVATIACHLKS